MHGQYPYCLIIQYHTIRPHFNDSEILITFNIIRNLETFLTRLNPLHVKICFFYRYHLQSIFTQYNTINK